MFLGNPYFAFRCCITLIAQCQKKISATVSRYVSNPLLSRGKENVKKEVKKLFVGGTGPPNLSIVRYSCFFENVVLCNDYEPIVYCILLLVGIKWLSE